MLKLDTKWKQEYADGIADLVEWELLNEVINVAAGVSLVSEFVSDTELENLNWKAMYAYSVLERLLIAKCGWRELRHG